MLPAVVVLTALFLNPSRSKPGDQWLTGLALEERQRQIRRRRLSRPGSAKPVVASNRRLRR